jgi:hypothetical protein
LVSTRKGAEHDRRRWRKKESAQVVSQQCEMSRRQCGEIEPLLQTDVASDE